MEQIICDICTRMDKLEALVRDNSKPDEPLRELIELRTLYKELKAQKEDVEIECFNAKHRLKALKFTNPLPCTRFKNSTKKEWAEKINEEVSEVIEAMYDPEKSTHDLLREMVDVVTVMKSFAYAIGVDDNRWGAMQKWVNENNARRGYFNEP